MANRVGQIQFKSLLSSSNGHRGGAIYDTKGAVPKYFHQNTSISLKSSLNFGTEKSSAATILELILIILELVLDNYRWNSLRSLWIALEGLLAALGRAIILRVSL